MSQNKKICPFPFSRMTLGRDHFIPCCASWLSKEYYKLDHSGNPWESNAAIELRQSIIDGNYKFCHKELCRVEEISIDREDEFEASDLYISEKTLEKIRQGRGVSNLDLTSVSINVDKRCNLACPSCRKEKITTLSKDEEKEILFLHLNLKKILKNIKKITFAGYGEFFFLDWTKKLVSKFNEITTPELSSIYILTNGSLLNEKSFLELGSGTKYIDTLDISIDAGDEETYKKVRGGNWKKLLKNLDYIKTLREGNKINSFRINFVVQKNNIESVEKFIELGEKLDVDLIIFSELLDWDSVMSLDYYKNAIHLKDHPDYVRYLEVRDKVQNHPRVLWRIE